MEKELFHQIQREKSSGKSFLRNVLENVLLWDSGKNKNQTMKTWVKSRCRLPLSSEIDMGVITYEVEITRPVVQDCFQDQMR